MDAPKPARRCICLSHIALVLLALPIPAFAAKAAGRFEVCCDGVGIFLAAIEGAPEPGKLVLFSYVNFPLGTAGGNLLGQGRWSEVYVLRDGCVPDGRCKSIAHGKVWIDAWDTPDAGNGPPRSVSGKYEIDLNGKHLEGHFVAKRHLTRHVLRVCM
jgi:hypothetical protein